MDKKLSREELIKQLKAISKEEVPKERNIGAMCYSPVWPDNEKEDSPGLFDIFSRKKIIWCNKCHKTFLCDRDQDEINKHNRIKKLVRSMARMGYDVKIKSICKNCCNELKEELYPDIDEVVSIISLDERNHVFYFRTNSDEPYHCAISNHDLYYKAVLAFLQGKSSYLNNFDDEKFLTEEIHVLEYMTGLKIDE